MAIVLVAAACPEQDPDPGPQPRATASPSPSASTDAADVVRFGVLGEPATLDPYAPTASDLTWALARPLYPSLYRFLPDGSTEPLLAEDLEATAQGVVVRLREAEWSDGRPITADDVVASWSRAHDADASPSGFGEVTRARARGDDMVELQGDVDEWETLLARVAYVLPEGRHGRATAGPFRLAERTPGLEIVLEPDPGWFGGDPGTATLRIQFIQSTGTMLGLLEDGRLEGAAVPSTVNLEQRAEAQGLEARATLGWESLRLRFGAGLDRDERSGFLAALELGRIEEVLIRDDGARSTTLHPSPDGATGPYRDLGEGRRPGGELTVTSPGGDELGSLLLRAVYAQIQEAGIVAEASPIDPSVFYGAWGGGSDDPSDVSIRRAAGAPGLDTPRDDPQRLEHAPLFHVATYVVTRPGFAGPDPNPTFDGPLWNAHEWGAA